jgi:two-component sensor histidine kinase
MTHGDLPVLILAPGGRDATVGAAILEQAGIAARSCPDLCTLMPELFAAGCAVLTEEALTQSDMEPLAHWIRAQPPWSDFPFLLLTLRGRSADVRLIDLLGNVTILERPFHPSVLVNAVRSALRARARQKEAEAYLEERRRSDEHKALLIRELHHRVKNTLATVLALVRAPTGAAETGEGFKRVFSERILALSRTHSLLVETSWRTASLVEILRNELGPYDGTGAKRVPKRVLLAGEEVELAGDLAVPVGMAIHELATNAAKYGALSVPDGHVEVVWEVARGDCGPMLHLTWTERDGPPVVKPSRTGFGSKLIERVLTLQCRATIALDFDPEGLRFRMELPLASTARSATPKHLAPGATATVAVAVHQHEAGGCPEPHAARRTKAVPHHGAAPEGPTAARAHPERSYVPERSSLPSLIEEGP